MSIPLIKLNDGKSIPQIGLGLWQVKDLAEFDSAFQSAVDTGYRHFDSAQFYQNEHMLGAAWKASGLPRDEFYLTTKIAVTHFGKHLTTSSFHKSLEKLKTDYVDLLLLHFPVTGMRKSSWLALEKLQAEGFIRSIGVSNYTIKHLEEMAAYASVVPAVNQVELHVFLQQPELVDYCRQKGIVVEAYSPLAHAKAMDNSTLAEIAQKHSKTYAQIMLRWLVEKGYVILPKSVTPARIQENFQVFDFSLDEDDKAKIAALDKNMRTAWSPVHVP